MRPVDQDIEKVTDIARHNWWAVRRSSRVGSMCIRPITGTFPGRYCVHILATRHRDVEAAGGGAGGAALELGTPVLERCAWGAAGALPVSAAWLLAATAPPLYSRPARPPLQPHPGETRPTPPPPRVSNII